MQPWLEYAELVQQWDELVTTTPTANTYRQRWQARIKHQTWEKKRQALIWMCRNKCERCGQRGDLQLHHLHYHTLWYESHQDLELLCRPCHYDADKERASMEILKNSRSVEERARTYMEMANRHSGQPDWPVTYQEALNKVRNS